LSGDSSLRLEGPLKQKSVGLKHLSKPPDLRGRRTGVRYSVTFYFDREEDAREVAEFFRRGRSRVPSGEMLLAVVKKLKKEGFEWTENA
jgi:hypothetical protein